MIEKNSYDLVLTDLKTKDIDGMQILRKTKKIRPETEVMVMASSATIKTIIDAIKLGAHDYILKPFRVDEMELLIERCMEKKELINEVTGLNELVNLYQLSRDLRSIEDLDKMLCVIMDLIAETLKAEGGSIMILDEEKGKLKVRAAIGKKKKKIMGKTVKMGERIAGYAAEKEDKVLIEGSLKKDPRFSHLKQFEGVESAITVPLIRKGRVLGVINLNRSSNKPGFTDNDLKLLSIFAGQAAVAIENSYLVNNLKKEKEISDTLFSEMGDGAVILDKDFNIKIINQAAENLLGIKREECLNKNFKKSLSDFETSKSWDEVKKSDQDIISFDLIRKKGKLLYISVFISKIKDDEGNIKNYIMVLRNSTYERKEELYKGNFLPLMSHKLRTPLTSILSFSSLLNRKETMGKLSDSEKEYLKYIRSKAKKLSSLIDKILRYTQVEADAHIIDRTPENISNIIDSAIESINDFIKKERAKITVSKKIKKLPEIKVDRKKIKEVIRHILENAIKFNNKKSKKINIDGYISNGYIQLEIQDNGPGIPPEAREIVFQKFRQLEDHFTGQIDGFGLGLSIARRIIESHRGKIWIESKIGRGSKFIFTLPIKK